MKYILIILTISLNLLALSLDGVWQTDCLNGNQKIQVIKEPQIYTFEVFFKDQDCKTRSFYFLNQGLFSKDNRKRNPTNFKNMDYIFDSVSLNIHTSEIIESFNKQGMCGDTNWILNRNHDITGKKCFFFSATTKHQVPFKNEARFGIYELKNNQLYFGKINSKNNALTPTTRPIELDPRYYYKVK